MRFVHVILGLLILASFSLAVEYITHDLSIFIPYSGDVEIIEKYQVRLNSTEMQEWQDILSGNASLKDLINLGVGPSFKVNVLDYHLSYKMGESGFAQVTLQYKTDSLIHKIADKGSIETVEIRGDDSIFQQGNKFVLPLKPSTTLTIQLPRTYSLTDIPQPKPTEQRILAQVPGYSGEFYEFKWEGPLSSEGFKLVFEREKSIRKQFTWQGVLEDLIYKLSNPLYLAVLVIIIILAIIYRKQIVDLFKEVFAEEPIQEEES